MKKLPSTKKHSKVSPTVLEAFFKYVEAECDEHDAPTCPRTRSTRIAAARAYERLCRNKEAKGHLWWNHGCLNSKHPVVRAAMKTTQGNRIVRRFQSHGFGGLN